MATLSQDPPSLVSNLLLLAMPASERRAIGYLVVILDQDLPATLDLVLVAENLTIDDPEVAHPLLAPDLHQALNVRHEGLAFGVLASLKKLLHPWQAVSDVYT